MRRTACTIETEVRAAESKIDIEKLKADVEGKETGLKTAEAGKLLTQETKETADAEKGPDGYGKS